MLKFLLASTAAFAPPGEGDGGNGGADGPENEALQEDEGQGEAGEDGGEVPESGEGEEEVDAAAEDGEGEVDPEPRRPSRAQSRIQSLTTTAREAKEKADRLEREIADFRADERRRTQQAQQESPSDRAARRALMDPMEIMREDLRESEARTANALHQNAMQQQEVTDKQNYNSILRDAPHLKKYDAEVEKIRLEQQAKGMFVPREVLLDLAIGRAARAAATRQAPKAKAKGQERIAAQQSRQPAARGDTATQRGRQGDSVEKRLENVPI